MVFGIFHGDHRAVARPSVAGGMTAVVNILTSRLKTKRPTLAIFMLQGAAKAMVRAHPERRYMAVARPGSPSRSTPI